MSAIGDGERHGGEPRLNGAGGRAAHPARAGFDERQIAAALEAVMDRVRRSFGSSLDEADVEDAAQEAWAALLAAHRDEPIRDLNAFVAEVGWRSARAVLRRPRPVPLDPEDSALLEGEDLNASALDRVDDRARMARVVEALEQMGEPQREAFQLWFVEEVDPAAACERLGISRSAYFKRLTVAKDQLEGAIRLDSHRFSSAQRRLLSDYVAGIATGRTRARAERLIAADPQAAAMAREIRRTHEAAAVVLPVLAAAPLAHGDVASPLAGLFERVRDLASGLFGRGAGPSEVASSPILTSGGARGAGAAAAGVAAKAFGGIGAGGVALGCLGGGAAITAACLATGLVSLPGTGLDRASDAPAQVKSRAGELSTAPANAGRLTAPQPVTAVTSALSRQPGRDGRENSDETSSPKAAPTLDSSTPPEVQEFGVDAAGTPVGGAATDRDESNGASASTVKQQFGP